MATPRAFHSSEKHAVGWFDRADWRFVRECLYSDEVAKQRHAVGRIAVWKSRMQKQLPLAIECTCGIIQAVIEDKLAMENLTINEKDLSLRMNYSTALIRFVSLLTEKLQTRMEAQPMHILAKSLGVPHWMVELRHDASHGPLPSLHLMRQGTQTALALLKKEYWEVERMSTDVNVTVSHTELNREKYAEKALVKYMQERYTAMSSMDEAPITSAEKNVKIPEVGGIKKLTWSLKRDSEAFLRCLLKNGYLIPEEEQLRALNIDVKRYVNSDILGLPLSLVEMWSEFVVQLDSLLPRLLSMALSEAGQTDRLRRKLLYSWVALLLESINAMNASEGKINRGLLYLTNRPSIDFHMLLEIVTKSPNETSRQLLPMILMGIRPKLNCRQRNKILHLTDMLLQRKTTDVTKTGKIKKKRLTNIEGIRDLRRNMEDALEKIRARTRSEKIHTLPAESRDSLICEWKRSSAEVQWVHVPFGQCPGNSLVNSKNLELGIRDFESCEEKSVASSMENAAISNGSADNDEGSTLRVSVDIEKKFDWSLEDLDDILYRIEPFV